MRKDIFYNNKSIDDNFEIKNDESVIIKRVKKIQRVNINSLLNRVKIEKKNETKKKIIFFSLGVSLIGIMGIFVTLVK
ncbi:hypothetical protein N9S92_00745 [Candidatus Pelagibacter sp.]|nr:hypothetical protein [Candidatus Pelagibacter sp.]MDA9646278.1 hypothetical protein [Candidatus Pelagibacter sp.]